MLARRHLITLISRKALLTKAVIAASDILVVDFCNSNKPLQEIRRFLKKLTQSFPEKNVVLYDGGLSENEKATAFQAGVRDYFSEPYDKAIILERLEFLCQQ